MRPVPGAVRGRTSGWRGGSEEGGGRERKRIEKGGGGDGGGGGMHTEKNGQEEANNMHKEMRNEWTRIECWGVRKMKGEREEKKE